MKVDNSPLGCSNLISRMKFVRKILILRHALLGIPAILHYRVLCHHRPHPTYSISCNSSEKTLVSECCETRFFARDPLFQQIVAKQG